MQQVLLLVLVGAGFGVAWATSDAAAVSSLAGLALLWFAGGALAGWVGAMLLPLEVRAPLRPLSLWWSRRRVF